MYHDLVQLADEVWLYPKDDNLEVDQPNVGAILLENQTILIDAGNSPRHARRIMSSLATIGAAPIDYLIHFGVCNENKMEFPSSVILLPFDWQNDEYETIFFN